MSPAARTALFAFLETKSQSSGNKSECAILSAANSNPAARFIASFKNSHGGTSTVPEVVKNLPNFSESPKIGRLQSAISLHDIADILETT